MSVSVAVDLYVEDLLSGKRLLCAQGQFVLVALDEHGKPTPVLQMSEDALESHG
jgi:acyl-CoA hydrolase